MDTLQFQKAEFADPRPLCAGCKTRIDGTYYQYGGREICDSCSAHIRAAQSTAPAAPPLSRPLLFGAAAALACSAAYALITFMLHGAEIGIIAIGVGYLVGRAIRIGANNAGARPLQIMAVVLTYLSITLSYVPLILREVPVAHIASALPTVIGYSLASPLLNLQNPASGILGIIILGVGLLQAWRLTAPRRFLPLTGPFGPTPGPSVV
ncbi:MAG TPA: hypothetical protein VGN17_20850 [Bryobacteraceae bacterium]|jgi:hypothetical protein